MGILLDKIPDAIIKERLRIAICLLFKYDAFLLQIQSERAIAHKLAEYLQHQFPEWNVDCEYNRHLLETKEIVAKCLTNKTGRVVPDIIIHHRNTDNNLVVIEIKSDGKDEVDDCADKKLKEFTIKKSGNTEEDKNRFEYDFGVFIGFKGTKEPTTVLYQCGGERSKPFLRNIFLFLLLIFFAGTGFAQDAAEYAKSGMVKDSLKDYTGAIQDYTKAIEVYPYGYTYYRRGNAERILKQYQEAIKDYTKAIEQYFNPDVYPEDAYEAAYYYRGVTKDSLKDYQGAIKDELQVINNFPAGGKKYILEIFPTSINAYCIRGIAKFQLEDYRGAIQDENEAIELNPNKDAYYYRGVAKIHLGDKDGGCLDLSKAGELGDSLAYVDIKQYCN